LYDGDGRQIATLLIEFTLPPVCQLEITESSIMADRRAQTVLEQLDGRDCTSPSTIGYCGYSSLAYAGLPVRGEDRRLVRRHRAENTPGDRAIDHRSRPPRLAINCRRDRKTRPRNNG
jgi:hypothetical protein